MFIVNNKILIDEAALDASFKRKNTPDRTEQKTFTSAEAIYTLGFGCYAFLVSGGFDKLDSKQSSRKPRSSQLGLICSLLISNFDYLVSFNADEP